MIAKVQKSSAQRSFRKARQREIQAALLAFGFTPARGKTATPEGSWSRRFRDLARRLGPGFVLFAHYLASRPDLIPLDDLSPLEALSPDDLALPAANPVAEIDRRSPRSVDELFTELDSEPLARGWTHDAYRARLREHPFQSSDSNAERRDPRLEAIVNLPKPGLQQALSQDLSELPLLRPAFSELLGSAFARQPLQDVLLDFQQCLEARLDPHQELLSLAQFADDLVDHDLWVTPEIFPELGGSEIGVRASAFGKPLESLVRDFARNFADGDSPDGPARRQDTARCRELARRLNLGMLQQALVTGHLPLDAEWVVQHDGRLALLGASFQQLPATARPRLWAYLTHLAAHRPEEAFDAIAGEFTPLHRAADLRSMRLRMRQLVPFRDGGWTERRDTLAELLALHWRLCQSHGFAPSPSLAALWSALFQIARHGYRLGVGGDPLRDALEDLRWIAGFRSLRRLSDPRELGQSMEANLGSLMELPQKLDRLLHLVSGEDGEELKLKLRVSSDNDSERRRSALQTALGLGILMIAVGLLAHRLPSFGMSKQWTEPVSAVLFLGLGIWLLGTLTRT